MTKSSPHASPFAQTPSVPPDQTLERTIALRLVILVLAAFLACVSNDFVTWDDDVNFVANPFFLGLGLDQFRWAWTTYWLGVYQPIAWMILEIQSTLGGLRPAVYHVFSVALYAASILALFRLLDTLLEKAARDELTKDQRQIACGLAAGVFAVHPLRVEVVAWASCQPYIPCALFAILAVLSYVRNAPAAEPIEQSAKGSNRSWWWLSAWLWLLAALLCKAVALGVPAALVVLDVYPLRRIGPGRWWTPQARRVYLEKVPFFLLTLVFVLVAYRAKASAGQFQSVSEFGLLDRAAQSCLAVMFYLEKSLVPLGLCAYYPAARPVNPTSPMMLLGMAGTVGITVGFWLLRKRAPGLPAAWVAFLAILAPNLGLLQLDDRLAADRYAFLPSIGFAAVLAAALARWGSSRPGRLAASGLIVILALLSIQQCGTWRDSWALWSHAYHNGASANASVNFSLGLAASSQGRAEEARAWYQRALSLNPRYHLPHNNLGVLDWQAGQFDQALAHLRRAVELQPGDASSQRTLGSMLAERGQLESAEAHLREAVRLKPDFLDARLRLANVLERRGLLDAALEQLEQATIRVPGDPIPRYHAGRLLLSRGDTRQASARLESASRSRPNLLDARRLLAICKQVEGKTGEALALTLDLVREHPDLADARDDLAALLEALGDHSGALVQHDEARRLRSMRQTTSTLVSTRSGDRHP